MNLSDIAISDYDSSAHHDARLPLVPFGVYGDPGGVPLPTLYSNGSNSGGLNGPPSSSIGPFGPPMMGSGGPMGGMGGPGGGRRMGAIEFLGCNSIVKNLACNST